MSTSIEKPGMTLAEELRSESDGEASVTPMDAVLEAARKGQLSEDHCFKIARPPLDAQAACNQFFSTTMKVRIEQTLCIAFGLCREVCPEGAVHPENAGHPPQV
jgi:ferredoxin